MDEESPLLPGEVRTKKCLGTHSWTQNAIPHSPQKKQNELIRPKNSNELIMVLLKNTNTNSSPSYLATKSVSVFFVCFLSFLSFHPWTLLMKVHMLLIFAIFFPLVLSPVGHQVYAPHATQQKIFLSELLSLSRIMYYGMLSLYSVPIFGDKILQQNGSSGSEEMGTEM